MYYEMQLSENMLKICQELVKENKNRKFMCSALLSQIHVRIK